MLLASLTDSLVTFATHVVSDLGLAGIFVLMLLESACIPIPSEATMLFAGFGVSQGHHSLLAITAAGVAGNLCGSWLAYAVGRYGGEALSARSGRLHLNRRHLASAERWFARFSLLTLAGCIPWVLLLGFIGQQLGHNWHAWRSHFEYVDYAVVGLAVAGALYAIVRRPWRGGREATADAGA